MKKKKWLLHRVSLLVSIVVLMVSLVSSATAGEHDPLPSWNDGIVKQAVVDFVQRVTDKNNRDFVPSDRRIAVFDNDGTLWSEKPLYFEIFFVFDQIRALAPAHPEWKTQQPYKDILENNLKGLATFDEYSLMKVVMGIHQGKTTDEFDMIVRNWIDTARHPHLKRPYTDLVYQPMLEVLRYLRDRGFKTFIASGGNTDFMRPWVTKAYGIPPEQVVGSSSQIKYELRHGIPVLIRLPNIHFIDDGEGKPVGIHKFIGRRPLVAFGNSDGDLPMLQWTAAGEGARLMLIVHHTDAEREWAYDRDSFVGRLNKGLDEADKRGWLIIDMKRDWKVIYPFQLPKQTSR